MALTFAGNGIYLGALAGLAAAVITRNVAVGLVVGIGGAVAGWYGIRAVEKLLGRGVTAGFTAASNWANRPKPPHQYQPQPPQQQYPHHQIPSTQRPPAGPSPQGSPPPHLEGEQPWG